MTILNFLMKTDFQTSTQFNCRHSSWYGNCSYTYGSTTHEQKPIPRILRKTMDDLSASVGVQFNSVLINYYKDGNDFMPYHADDETSIVSDSIASLSLGATRLFCLKPSYDSEVSHHVYLSSGSLIVMSGQTQKYWRHSIVKEPYITLPRINLTFRAMK